MRRSAGRLGGWLAAAIAIGLALRATGCTPELCLRNSDCPSGLVCLVDGSCGIAVVPGDDAGVDPDTGSQDASTVDAVIEIP
jgi:hypothetical protein